MRRRCPSSLGHRSSTPSLPRSLFPGCRAQGSTQECF
nr:MAG TPA: hypothetical protein [Caudoviricetes sp.]